MPLSLAHYFLKLFCRRLSNDRRKLSFLSMRMQVQEFLSLLAHGNPYLWRLLQLQPRDLSSCNAPMLKFWARLLRSRNRHVQTQMLHRGHAALYSEDVLLCLLHRPWLNGCHCSRRSRRCLHRYLSHLLTRQVILRKFLLALIMLLVKQKTDVASQLAAGR